MPYDKESIIIHGAQRYQEETTKVIFYNVTMASQNHTKFHICHMSKRRQDDEATAVKLLLASLVRLTLYWSVYILMIVSYCRQTFKTCLTSLELIWP